MLNLMFFSNYLLIHCDCHLFIQLFTTDHPDDTMDNNDDGATGC